MHEQNNMEAININNKNCKNNIKVQRRRSASDVSSTHFANSTHSNNSSNGDSSGGSDSGGGVSTRLSSHVANANSINNKNNNFKITNNTIRKDPQILPVLAYSHMTSRTSFTAVPGLGILEMQTTLTPVCARFCTAFYVSRLLTVYIFYLLRLY